jgi:hypothetical protein
MNILNHHDRIIDHQTDGGHHAAQRLQVEFAWSWLPLIISPQRPRENSGPPPKGNAAGLRGQPHLLLSEFDSLLLWLSHRHGGRSAEA